MRCPHGSNEADRFFSSRACPVSLFHRISVVGTGAGQLRFITSVKRSARLLSSPSMILSRPACGSPGRQQKEPPPRRHSAAMPCLPAVDLNVVADATRKQANVRTSELPQSAASRTQLPSGAHQKLTTVRLELLLLVMHIA